MFPDFPVRRVFLIMFADIIDYFDDEIVFGDERVVFDKRDDLKNQFLQNNGTFKVLMYSVCNFSTVSPRLDAFGM